MDGKLTVEKAKQEPLSWKPWKRGAQVLAILSSPEHIGEDTDVVVNRDVYVVGRRSIIGVSTISPFLGRRALINVAKTLEYIEEHTFAPGGELGLHFFEGPSTVTQIAKPVEES